MKNFRRFWRKRNFTGKCRSSPSCTKPFNCSFQFRKCVFIIALLLNSAASIRTGRSPAPVTDLAFCLNVGRNKPSTWHVEHSCWFVAHVKFALPFPPLYIKFVLTEVKNMMASDMYTEHINCDKTTSVQYNIITYFMFYFVITKNKVLPLTKKQKWVYWTIRLRARVFYEQIVNKAQLSWLSLVENKGE